MPKFVKINVEDSRLYDNGRVCEDVTQVALPTLEFPTTDISVSGTAMDISIPNHARIGATTFGVTHNNGENCQYLNSPGIHNIEFRTVRQKYSVGKTVIEHESVKYRLKGMISSIDNNAVENGNPLGTTVTYQMLGFERIVAGKVDMQVDFASNKLVINGVSTTDDIQRLL